MEKFVPSFALVGAVFLASCTTKNNNGIELVGSKMEPASVIDSTEIQLYACAENIDFKVVKEFCERQKKEFTDSQYHVLVFFDHKDNVVYPQLPDPGLYFPEERFLKHIKGICRYNYISDKAELEYYSNNMWEGKTTAAQL